MNEASGFPAPTLSPPGSAPTLPPSSAASGPAVPAASQPLTAPTLPDFGGTTLQSQTSAPATAKKRSSSTAKLLPIVLILGAGALGYVGYANMSNGEADVVVESPVATVAPVATSAILVPINNAKDLVDQINDNSTEQEMFDELGLGSRGEDLTVGATRQLHAADVIEDNSVTVVGAPAFTYRYHRGIAAAQSVWVDSATGNRELFDGTTYVRFVDGAAFHTTDPTTAWIADPTMAPTDSLALFTDMVTIDQVLPEAIVNEVTATTAGDRSASGRYLFVDTELAAAAPQARAAWLASWGFDPAVAPVAADAFVDGVPDAAAPGLILVTVATSADGIVTAMTIEAPATGDQVDYRLIGASPDALVISRPATVAE